MARLIDQYHSWRQTRLERKLARYVTPPPQQAVSTESRRLARTQLHGFSALTWDDIGQRYTMLGPMQAVYTLGFTDTDLDRLLRASAWSWASINGNAKAMSQLTPVVQERKAGMWARAAASHPLWKFLDDPLGIDDRLPWWSWAHLLYVIGLQYYTAGNAYLVPVDAPLAGLSVVPLLHPTQMIVDDVDLDKLYEVPRLYKYQRVNGGPMFTFTPDKIVNIMAPGPSSFWKGASPLRAALRATEIDHVATERQRYNMRNRIAPGPVISFDAPMGPTEEQRALVKQELLDDYRNPENDGDPLVLGSGAKIDRGFDAKELQVFDTKKSAREDIIAVIGTQPSIMGQLDNATYSNTKEATVLWFSGSVGPVLGVIYGDINAQLVRPRFGSDTRLWYSLAGSHIGMQLMAAQIDVATGLQALGYTTNDIDAHLEMGMGEKDYLDKSTGADVIAGRAGPDEEPPPTPPASDDATA